MDSTSSDRGFVWGGSRNRELAQSSPMDPAVPSERKCDWGMMTFRG